MTSLFMAHFDAHINNIEFKLSWIHLCGHLQLEKNVNTYYYEH